MKKRRTNAGPSWSFLWTSTEKAAYGNDTWRLRTYRARDIAEACWKMYEFLAGRRYDTVLDYEAYAAHLGTNIDLQGFDNPLRTNWL